MNALVIRTTLASLDVIFVQKEYSDGRNSSRFLSGHGVYTTEWRCERRDNRLFTDPLECIYNGNWEEENAPYGVGFVCLEDVIGEG